MGGFRRSLFGYRRADVEAVLTLGETRILDLERTTDAQHATISELEGEATALSGMVLERERELRSLREELGEANELHDHRLAAIDAITARLEELEAQARGQAIALTRRRSPEWSQMVVTAPRGVRYFLPAGHGMASWWAVRSSGSTAPSVGGRPQDSVRICR